MTGIINGRYQRHSQIGEGGMGVVYRATDRLTGEIVALKQIHLSEQLQVHDSLAPGATEDDLRLALAREFQILAGLRHPHIISVLDYGFDGAKRPYFTMTYLPETETILDAAKDQPFERKIELIQQLLQALAYLHRRGVLHRDLKPDNVLVSDGAVRVLDFGLSVSDTVSSDSVGTPLYMAPELLDGNAYTRQADLYAVGVLLYQLLTGKHPFEPFDFAFLGRVLQAEPDWSEVDVRIRPFLTQLLVKTANKRFATAPDALAALADAINQPPPPETAAIRESYLQAAKFVGRDAEMAQLNQALRNAVNGTNSVWLVGGESGVGKSRLVNEFRTLALVQGWQVLSGQAVEQGGAPYQLWQEIVPRLVLNAAIGNLDAGVLQEIVPTLHRLFDHPIEPPPPLTRDANRERQTSAVLTLLEQQTQPTLLLFEDLQWATESLYLLQKILNTLSRYFKLVVVGTYRHEERPELPALLPNATALTLNRLAESDITQLTEAMLGAESTNPRIISLLVEQTEGNTFFIVEAMRALAAEAGRLDKVGQMVLPNAIFTQKMHQLLQRRLGNLSSEDLAQLQLAAVSGKKIDSALLKVLSNMSQQSHWLQRMADAAIIEIQSGEWWFAHDKLRETILSELKPTKRQTLHAQVAQGIEQIYSAQPMYYNSLVEHWHQAGNGEKVLLYLWEVVAEAVEITADYGLADVLLARGLTHLPPQDLRQINLRYWQTKNEMLQNRYKSAEKFGSENVALAQAWGDRLGEANALLNLGLIARRLGDSQKAEQYCQASLAIYAEEDEPRGMGQALDHLGQILLQQGKTDAAFVHLQQALTIHQQLDYKQGIATTLNSLGAHCFHLGSFENAESYYQRSQGIYREIGSQTGIANSFTAISRIAIVNTNLEVAQQYLEQSQEIWRKTGDLYGLIGALSQSAYVMMLQGNYAKAQEKHLESLSLSRNFGLQQQIANALLDLAALGELFNDLEAAKVYANEGLAIYTQDKHHVGVARSFNVLGNIERKLGNFETALGHYQEAKRLAHKSSSRANEAINFINIATVYCQMGKASEAKSYLQPIMEIMPGVGTSKLKLAVLAIFGWIRLVEGYPQEGARLVGLALAHRETTFEVQKRVEEVLTALQAVVDDETLAKELKRGEALDFEEALAQVVSVFTRDDVPGLVADELANKPINGRYQLHTKLGEGGMGIVYRATDRLTGETVALKQVHLSNKLHISDSIAPNATEDDLRLALAHEFQTLAGLRHPHIISVLDYGFDDEKRPFFTMNFLPQPQTILDAAKNRSFAHKIELIQQLLQALAYLHRRGVLHRDLKPDNVLVCPSGVRVLDFGLSVSITSSSDSVGTPLYMAPELFDGEPYNLLADLYSVGVLLYQIITSKHPFAPFDAGFLDRVLDKEPDWQAVAEPIRPFLQKLLAKQPVDRFQRADEALAALAELLGQPLPPETAAIRESYLQAAKFVGREAEMAQLAEALSSAASGQGSAWLIGGESGVGKTRLVDELRTQALVAGFEVLRGQTVEDGGLPYQAWRAPVRQLVATLPDIDDLTASVLLPLVPDMAHLLNRPVEPAPELKEEAVLARLFTTIARLFWQVERPLLLILEGLHLADASLLPLPYLTRLVSEHKLLILGCYRSDERPSLPQELPEMQSLPLPRLSAQAMAELSAAMLGDAGRNEAIVALLQQETEGNAFFAVEVVRALAAEAGRLGDIGQMTLPKTLLPNGIHDIVQRRVSKLPDEARQLLVKTAVAGRELEIPLVQQLGDGLDVENEWLPLCADAAILDVQNGIWQFSHGKIRDGLLAELTQAEKVRLHGDVATAIEALYPDDETQVVRLAYHWQEANNPDKERPYAQLAGQQAATQYAHADALRYFNRAIELTPGGDMELQFNLHLACFTAYQFMRNADKQLQTLDLLSALADKLADDAKQLQAMLLYGHYFTDSSQWDEAEATFLQIVTLGTEKNQLLLAAKALSALVYVLGSRRQLAEAQQKLAQCELILAQLDAVSEQKRLLNQYGLLAHYSGDSRQAVIYDEEYLQFAEQENDLNAVNSALNNLALNLNLLGEFERAQAYQQEALRVVRQIGDVYGESILFNNMGIQSVDVGEYDASIESLENCLALSRQIGDWVNHSYALNNIGVAYCKKGVHEQAGDYFRQAVALKHLLNDPWSEAYTWNHIGHLNLDRDVVEEALTAYQTAESLQTKISQTPTLVETWAGLAAALARQGQVAEARSYAERVWNHLQSKGFGGEWAWGVSVLHLHEAFGYLKDGRETAVIQQAHTQLQERAANIATEASREKYLTQVPENRMIVQLHEAIAARPLANPLAATEEAIFEQLWNTEAEDEAEPHEKLRGEALLTQLLGISRRMATMRSVDPLLSYAMNEVIQLVEAERGYIVLINEDGSLDFRVRRRFDGSDIQSDADTISHSILDEVVRTQQSLVVRNALLDPRFAQAQSVVVMQLRSIMCAPLITQDRIIGAIYVESRSRSGRFTEEDLAPLEFFSNQAAVAIENANLNENLEELVDERTHQLAEAKEAAEKANLAKTTFLSNMSHELRTPLNAVLNFAGFVYDELYGEINQEQKNALQQVLDSGEHLLSLINDILDLNKVEAGMMQLAFEAIDMNQIMYNAISTATGLIKSRPIELVLAVDSDLPVIQADRRRLRQILLNILSNAAKYTDQGRITIAASHLVNEDVVEIKIQDTGIGIAAKDHYLVFEAYGQARANESNVVSTGLGMAITHDLVALHNGRIWFESEEGRGTTFFVHLPVRQESQ